MTETQHQTVTGVTDIIFPFLFFWGGGANGSEEGGLSKKKYVNSGRGSWSFLELSKGVDLAFLVIWGSTPQVIWGQTEMPRKSMNMI